MIGRILCGLDEFTAAFVDDVVIFSETWDKYLKHLLVVFERLNSAGLTPNPKKLYFAMQEVLFLAHTVGGGIVNPNEQKIDAVKNFPRPTTKSEVRSFLGLSGYCRKFIPNYADVSASLSDLIKKCESTKVKWSNASEDIFQ